MSQILGTKIGNEVIGPVVHYYLAQLDHHIRQLDDGETRFLFVSRAGVRIRKLYESYLRLTGAQSPAGMETFWVSRMLLGKGIFGRDAAKSIEAIGRELAHHPMSEAVACIFAAEVAHGGMQVPAAWADLPRIPLHEFVTEDSAEAKRLVSYLSEQSSLFEEYLERTMGDSRRAVLIDSGWQGTAQGMLAGSFGQYDWFGLYFGRMTFGTPIPSALRPYMVGLVFEADGHVTGRPETAIALHRHLVESLFEPNAPSIERLARGPDGVFAPESALVLAESVLEDDDAHFVGVLQYLEQNCAKVGHGELMRRYVTAIDSLSRMLREPTRDEALALMGKQRSADFGRSIKVPVLREPVDRNQWDSVEKRITEALWAQGQISLEYSGKEALHRQRASLCDAAASAAMETQDIWSVKGRVAIITRTKNRPVLFKRAARSVASQTYQNYLWVVVNDGGEPEEVKRIIAQSGVDPRRVLLCSNEESLGMEAASNVGIRASESEFVIIHDDDDSWAPNFLERMAAFLSTGPGRKYGGAISKCLYVSESINGDRVVEHGRWPYQDWVETVQLSEMVNGNFFAPIAFLFTRAIYNKLGGFDETLPVLGDWDFNLRFLLEADIGVVPEVLAYYHHRDTGGGAGLYSNSVIGASNKHAEYNAIVRNRFVRKAAGSGAAGLLAAIGYSTSDLRGRIGGITSAARREQQTDTSWLQVQTENAVSLADDRWVVMQVLAGKQSSGWGRRRTKQASPLLNYAQEVAIGSRSLVRRQLADHLRCSGVAIAPPPDFDEQGYLRDNPDVAAAVQRGELRTGFQHYYLFGCFEARRRN